MSTDGLIVFSTAPNDEVAEALAEFLVAERLAACVNLVDGIRSIYRWQGEVHRDSEVLLIVKSSRDLLEPLVETLQNRHPYDCPEIVAVPIVGGSGDYLAWMASSLASGSD
jgi:periplasmic divalent cation tolerance protein